MKQGNKSVAIQSEVKTTYLAFTSKYNVAYIKYGKHALDDQTFDYRGEDGNHAWIIQKTKIDTKFVTLLHIQWSDNHTLEASLWTHHPYVQ